VCKDIFQAAGIQIGYGSVHRQNRQKEIIFEIQVFEKFEKKRRKLWQ